jgi:hypothetical protein
MKLFAIIINLSLLLSCSNRFYNTGEHRIELKDYDIIEIDLQAQTLGLTGNGEKEMSKLKERDFLKILGVEFYLAENHMSYFPAFPVLLIWKDNKTIKYFFRIDHLNKDRQEQIIDLFSKWIDKKRID